MQAKLRYETFGDLCVPNDLLYLCTKMIFAVATGIQMVGDERVANLRF